MSDQPEVKKLERMLEGKWKNETQMLDFHIENGVRSGYVEIKSMDHEKWAMDYFVHITDGHRQLKLQNDAGEKNFRIAQLTSQKLYLTGMEKEESLQYEKCE